MSEFQKDKKKLISKLTELIVNFQNKHDVIIKEIEVNNSIFLNGNYDRTITNTIINLKAEM